MAKSTDCSIISDNTGLGVSLTWKHNYSDVKTLPRQQLPGIYQMNENDMQRLYINKTSDLDDGVYSCHASVGHATLVPKSFTLYFNGALIAFVQ